MNIAIASIAAFALGAFTMRALFILLDALLVALHHATAIVHHLAQLYPLALTPEPIRAAIEAIGTLAQHALSNHRTPTGAELALCPSLGAFTLSPLRTLTFVGLASLFTTLLGALPGSLFQTLAQLLSALGSVGPLCILALMIGLSLALALGLLVRVNGTGGGCEQGESGCGDQDQGVGSHGCIPLGWIVWARDHPSGWMAV